MMSRPRAIGDTQERVQGLLLCLLGLGKQARVVEREGRGECDLFEVVQIELREWLVRAPADREDAENAATGSERQDHARAHIRQLLLHIGRHARHVGKAFERHFTAVDPGAELA